MKEFEYTAKIMGTDLVVSVITEEKETAQKIFDEALFNLKKYEKQFSRFLSDSELSLLNIEHSRVVSPLFIEVLIEARELYRKTHGYFNPLYQIERLGYDATFDKIKNVAHEANTKSYNTRLEEVIIEKETSRVTLADDQKLDFGGFLKGYLAEMEAKRIMNTYSKVTGVIVNIGGDIHTRGVDTHGLHFIFEVENPITHSTISVPLQNGSLATSGTYKRTWLANGERVNHILGIGGTTNPETPYISASVIHENGGSADALAKALLALGHEELERITQTTIQGVLISRDGIEHIYL